MEHTRIAQETETGQPLTAAEKEQAGYALRELARSESDPNALKVPQQQLELVRPFFQLGWALGVRTGHTGPAMAGVPVDRNTVARAFVLLMSGRVADQLVIAVAQSLDPQDAGPVLWQKVRYHGSVAQRHGMYWVSAIHAYADPFGGPVSLRYDLCALEGPGAVAKVTNVRRVSLTPLSEYRTVC
ncbi:hypothetical protein [Streptomyces sp. NPDC056821]|uniref:hypothetical protein n=1 Tax=unclassified Streptomyces TaxID=2593676 RepID=UPI00368C7426